MAYRKWRKENINTLQHQQILEAAAAFKKYNLAENENNGINPTIGKKTLKRLCKIRESILKRKQVVIHEVISLESEISDIDFTDVIDELPRQESNILENQLNMSNDDESENDDSLSSESENDDNSEMDVLTKNIVSKILDSMTTTIFEIAKPNVNKMTERLKTLLEKNSISEEDRKNYKYLLKYFEDLAELYIGNLSALDITEKSERIKEKYGSANIEKFLNNDPNFADIMNNFEEINLDKLNDL